MQLQEGYAILGLSQGTGLEEVKKAFRRLAFELHPDLNPSHDAGPRFQRLNEAYVLVKAHLEKTGGSPSAGPTETAKQPPPPRGAERRERVTPPGEQPRAKVYYKKEEVLQDILKDPFARKVFEDIYNEISRSKKARPTINAGKAPQQREMRLEWGSKGVTFDFSQGVWEGIKVWIRGQLDERQDLRVDASGIRPGGVVRLQIREGGWSGTMQTLEVTLPAGYVPGQPIRLKGLGRRIGPWKGDLYVRLLAR